MLFDEHPSQNVAPGAVSQGMEQGVGPVLVGSDDHQLQHTTSRLYVKRGEAICGSTFDSVRYTQDVARCGSTIAGSLPARPLPRL